MIRVGAAALTGCLLVACAAPTAMRVDVQASPDSSPEPRKLRPSMTVSTPPSGASADRTPTPAETPRPRGPVTLTVPAADIFDAKVVYYRGEPDDARGTSINDDGLIGAPISPSHGVLPGQVGNLLLTGHRTSAGSPMLTVPELRDGDLIHLDQGGYRFTYRVSDEYWVNFRDRTSRAQQESPVPGRPGVRATRPAVVLSTCATPEDNAAGNYWRDEFSNPTHRIAVAGFLVSVRSPR